MPRLLILAGILIFAFVPVVQPDLAAVASNFAQAPVAN
jgi:hypothetical protein